MPAEHAEFSIDKAAEQEMDVPTPLTQSPDQLGDSLIVTGACGVRGGVADDDDLRPVVTTGHWGVNQSGVRD